MAKKGARQMFNLQCSICKYKNYLMSKNTTQIKDKLNFNKFCNNCRKVTDHLEIKLGK